MRSCRKELEENAWQVLLQQEEAQLLRMNGGRCKQCAVPGKSRAAESQGQLLGSERGLVWASCYAWKGKVFPIFLFIFFCFFISLVSRKLMEPSLSTVFASCPSLWPLFLQIVVKRRYFTMHGLSISRISKIGRLMITDLCFLKDF